MYHELTEQQIRKRSIKRLVIGALTCVLVVVCLFSYNALTRSLREQGAASVRQAIMDAAMQCCATEGAYPASLSHLEDSYGLHINHSDYIITYETFADNVMPSVVVVPR